MSTNNSEPEAQEWVLKPRTEYRFELDPGTSLAVKLVRGTAEIFGAELVKGKYYLFGFECKAAIFTWHGCTVQISQPSTEYVSEETPMAAYGNIHVALEQMRVRALDLINPEADDPSKSARPPEPPHVLIVGPNNSGKSTLCKILVNYAVRSGQNWSPLLVNVDPNDGGWGPPGTLSAAPITDPIHTYSAATPFGSAATTAPLSLSSNALLPLVYWYGHPDIKRNTMLMERLIRNLGINMEERFERDPEGKASGCIVNMPAVAVSGPAINTEIRQKLIKACVEAFKINVILVVGHEKLNVELKRSYGSKLTVVKVPKSGGVVELDLAYRERVHNYQLHTYMYGTTISIPPGVPSISVSMGGEPSNDLALSPASTTINFSDLSIYRIGAESMAPVSALPIGATRTVSEMEPVPVNPSIPGSGLLNKVMAIMAPFNPDENERYDEELLDLTVQSLIVVMKMDVKQKKMTILSPNLASIAGKTAIVGGFEWQDE